MPEHGNKTIIWTILRWYNAQWRWPYFLAFFKEKNPSWSNDFLNSWFHKNDLGIGILLIDNNPCSDQIHDNHTSVDYEHEEQELNRKLASVSFLNSVIKKSSFNVEFPNNHGKCFQDGCIGSFKNGIISKKAVEGYGKCSQTGKVYGHWPSHIFDNMKGSVDVDTKYVKSTQKQCEVDPSQKKGPTKKVLLCTRFMHMLRTIFYINCCGTYYVVSKIITLVLLEIYRTRAMSLVFLLRNLKKNGTKFDNGTIYCGL